MDSDVLDGSRKKLPEYRVWAGMKQRCKNPNVHNYKDYGGRGITVCERWEQFDNFYLDMGPRPSCQHSIERLDNDGHYEIENCKWATRKEQRANRRLVETGVSKHASGYGARLTVRGKRMWLGMWESEAIAKAVVEAAKVYFKD